MIIYRITDWDKHFEVNRTREMKRMAWVPVPNKMDGDGYTQLVDHKNGAAHFGAWVILLEVASRCEPRGLLVRDDATPHTPDSIARMSRLPASTILEALKRLETIGWVQRVNEAGEVVPQEPADSHPTLPQEGAGSRPPSPQEGAPRARAVWNGTEGTEGIERNGKKGTESLPAGERKARPLSNGEVQDYWVEAGLQGDPEDFFDFWMSRGWRDSAGPIRDWRARARTWSRREGKGNGGPRRLAHEINPDVRVGKGDGDSNDPAYDKLRELQTKYRHDPDRQNIVAREYREWCEAQRPADEESA